MTLYGPSRADRAITLRCSTISPHAKAREITRSTFAGISETAPIDRASHRIVRLLSHDRCIPDKSFRERLPNRRTPWYSKIAKRAALWLQMPFVEHCRTLSILDGFRRLLRLPISQLHSRSPQCKEEMDVAVGIESLPVFDSEVTST